MSDLVVRTHVATKLTVARVTEQLVAYGTRVAERAKREQTGQDVIEYAGMVVLVAAVIGALLALHIDKTVSQAVHSALNSIFGGGSGSGSGNPN